MNIHIISDIHMGSNKYKDNELKQYSQLNESDIIIISGDIASNDYKQIESTFKIIRDENPYVKILVVLGNHDYWTQSYDFGDLSVKKIIEEIKNYCKKYNIHYLENNMYENDKIEVYGYNGWYSDLNPPTQDLANIPANSGHDILTPSQFLSQQQNIAIDYILKEYEARKNSKKIKMIVSHFSPFGLRKSLLKPSESSIFKTNSEKIKKHEEKLNYQIKNFNPYPKEKSNFKIMPKKSCPMSSNENIFNLLIDESPDFYICGHTHEKMDLVIKKTRILNPGADYVYFPNETNKNIIKIEIL